MTQIDSNVQHEVFQRLGISANDKRYSGFGGVKLLQTDTGEIVLVGATDELPIRENVGIANATSVSAHYVNSWCTQIRWSGKTSLYGSETGIPPSFTNCHQTTCSTHTLPVDASICFYGHNKLYGCDFLQDQIAVVGDTTNTDTEVIELYNCHNVKLKLLKDNIEVIANGTTNLSFDANSKAPAKFIMNGGELTAPSAFTGAVNAYISNVTVTIPSAVTSVLGKKMDGCTFIVEATTGSVTFGGGIQFSNNFITRADEIDHSGVAIEFDSDMCAYNRVSLGDRPSISTGGLVQVSAGNFDGLHTI